MKGEEKRDHIKVSLHHDMYDNNAGSRTIISYNFLGDWVLDMSEEEIKEQIEDLGLNVLLDAVSNIANRKNLSVDEIIDYIYEGFTIYLDGYEKSRDPKYLNSTLTAYFEGVILLDIGDYDTDGNISFDVYSVDSKNISSLTKDIIRNVMMNLPKDVVNTNLIVVMVDLFMYGHTIFKGLIKI